jgi:hypothetical protein
MPFISLSLSISIFRKDQDGPERILTIAGELEPSLDCLTDALATMAENQKLRQDANELRALVHTSQAGRKHIILST